MFLRITLALLFGLALTAGASFYSGTATADNPAMLDSDVMSSLVVIKANGTEVGTGVVVTRDGIVVTSHAIAMLALRDKKTLVIQNLFPRTARVIALDAKSGLAALQMHGVIPPHSGVGYAQPPKGSLTVCGPDETPTKSLRSPTSGVCAVFTRQGKLLGVTVSGPGGAAAFIGNRIIRDLIGP